MPAIPAAWYGRIATPDEDIPFARQQRALAALERQRDIALQQAAGYGMEIVACYVDVGPGYPERTAELDALVTLDWRAGGIAELLADARRPDRPFTAVAIQTASRLSRSADLATQVCVELQQAGVRVMVAGEQMTPDREMLGALARIAAVAGEERDTPGKYTDLGRLDPNADG